MGPTVLLWKVSRRGAGGRHLRDGYTESDFPGREGGVPDGRAYFAASLSLAEVFSRPTNAGYEDFAVEIAVPRDEYESCYRGLERPVFIEDRTHVEVAVPSQIVKALNEHPRRRVEYGRR